MSFEYDHFSKSVLFMTVPASTKHDDVNAIKLIFYPLIMLTYTAKGRTFQTLYFSLNFSN